MNTVLSCEQTTHRTLRIERINDRLSWYEDRKEVFSGLERISDTVHKGIAKTTFLECTTGMDEIDTRIPVGWMSGAGHVVCIRKEDWERIMNGEVHISRIYDLFCDMETYDPEKYMYVIYSSYSWDVADLEGMELLHPISFDYIDGMVNSGRYDLEKVLEFMKGDPRFMPRRFANEDEIEVMQIPYYNADESTGDYAIEFMYMPSRADMAKMRGNGNLLGKSMFMSEMLNDFKKKKYKY